MSKLTDDLRNAGWIETTLGECRVGEEVVGLGRRRVSGTIENFVEIEGKKYAYLDTADVWRLTRRVLRAPRPEPTPEVGEVWWCRHDESGQEINLVYRGAGSYPWAGKISGTWKSHDVTPLRKAAHADGSPVLPDLPEWDPEREWPLGTVVDADGDYGRVRLVKADGEAWLSQGEGTQWLDTKDLRNVKVLSVPGHAAPSAPSLRERLLDEGTVCALDEEARDSGWLLSQGAIRHILTAAADFLDPEVTR